MLVTMPSIVLPVTVMAPPWSVLPLCALKLIALATVERRRRGKWLPRAHKEAPTEEPSELPTGFHIHARKEVAVPLAIVDGQRC